MKNATLKTLLLLVAVLLLACAWRLASGDPWQEWPRRLTSCAMALGGLAALFSLSFGRFRSEDQIARLEAQLCREQSARSSADEALAEADLLLARLTIQPPGTAAVAGMPGARLAAQLAQIQAELAQLQLQATLDAACARRLEGVRSRLEQVARLARGPAREAEMG